MLWLASRVAILQADGSIEQNSSIVRGKECDVCDTTRSRIDMSERLSASMSTNIIVIVGEKAMVMHCASSPADPGKTFS